MVQLSPVPAYDEENDSEQAPARGWSDLMSSAFSKFAASVSATSSQLSSAAEVFAGEAARLLGDASTRVEQAIARGGEMHEDYARALNDVQSAQHSLQELAQHAMDDVNRSVADANSVRESLDQMMENARDEFAKAFEEARALRDSPPPAPADVDLEAVSAAVMERVRAEMSTWTQPAADTTPRSEEERAGARAVLDRLETDYQRLRDLVRGLSEGIAAGFSTSHPPEGSPPEMQAEAPAAEEHPIEVAIDADVATSEHSEAMAWNEPVVAPEPAADPEATTWSEQAHETEPTAWSEPAHEAMVTAEPSTETREEHPSPWSWPIDDEYQDAAPVAHLEEESHEAMNVAEPAAWETVSQPEAQAETEAPEAEMSLDGRVTLTVEPIPDFDRLLNLDSALGRLPMVRNVTLADYTREEVTFRVEISDPIAVRSFANALGQGIGSTVEVVDAAAGSAHFHLGSAA